MSRHAREPPQLRLGSEGDVPSRGEARFANLLEAAPDAMVGVDQTGVIQFVNRQMESLFGYSRDELVGQPIETLVPEPFRQVHRNRRGGYIADPQTRAMGTGLELNGLRRDGTEFPVDVSLSSIETEDGLLVTAAVRDITGRKRAEARLKHQALYDQLTGLAITASVGIAIATGPDVKAEDLLRDADAAMYRAKELGRARHAFFDEAMRHRAITRFNVEADLIGFEALVRWHHPARGLVGPDEFISVAEDTGLIARLGTWVLEQACRKAGSWPSSRDDLVMSVPLMRRTVRFRSSPEHR